MNYVLKVLINDILKKLNFLPDNLILSLEYFYKLHRFPNLKNPQRFTEWIQWYKMYYRNELMFECVDKYAVRNYVTRNGCNQYLNTLYQVCNDANEIDFEKLPNKFVIKTTDGGNGENVYVCTSKSELDIHNAIKKVNNWRYKELYKIGREWAYTGCSDSRIVVEKYLSDPDSTDGSIDDYKLLCFHGKFRYLWVDKNRYSSHNRGFWDENLNFRPEVRSDHPTFSNPPLLPSNCNEMIAVAEKLAKDFPFARIDFYNIEGKIYFGEITFYPWSGYCQFVPDSFDFEMGGYFNK